MQTFLFVVLALVLLTPVVVVFAVLVALFEAPVARVSRFGRLFVGPLAGLVTVGERQGSCRLNFI